MLKILAIYKALYCVRLAAPQRPDRQQKRRSNHEGLLDSMAGYGCRLSVMGDDMAKGDFAAVWLFVGRAGFVDVFGETACIEPRPSWVLRPAARNSCELSATHGNVIIIVNSY
jgi:hypothetical protein